MVAMSKLGISFFTKSQAAFSANVFPRSQSQLSQTRQKRHTLLAL